MKMITLIGMNGKRLIKIISFMNPVTKKRFFYLNHFFPMIQSEMKSIFYSIIKPI